MPTYVYACQACEQVFERRQSFSEDPITVCEECGGEWRRVIQPVGIIFNRATPPPSEVEAAKPAPAAEDKAAAPATEAASTATASPTPAKEAAPAATVSDAAPSKEPAPAKTPATKETAVATKEPPAPPAEKPPKEDSGDNRWHRPPQRGSKWTSFIK
jgi:putative FmdB family regulatory protein